MYAVVAGTCDTVDLSTKDTLGTVKQFIMRRCPLFRGNFMHIAIHLDPQKQSVVERFLLLGEFVIRGSTVVGVFMYCTAMPVPNHPHTSFFTSHNTTTAYSETSVIQHIYNPTFSQIRPSYEVQSPCRKHTKRHCYPTISHLIFQAPMRVT